MAADLSQLGPQIQQFAQGAVKQAGNPAGLAMSAQLFSRSLVDQAMQFTQGQFPHIDISHLMSGGAVPTAAAPGAASAPPNAPSGTTGGSGGGTVGGSPYAGGDAAARTGGVDQNVNSLIAPGQGQVYGKGINVGDTSGSAPGGNPLGALGSLPSFQALKPPVSTPAQRTFSAKSLIQGDVASHMAGMNKPGINAPTAPSTFDPARAAAWTARYKARGRV